MPGRHATGSNREEEVEYDEDEERKEEEDEGEELLFLFPLGFLRPCARRRPS